MIDDSWPCLFRRRRAEQDEVEQFLCGDLQLGVNYPVNVCSKSYGQGISAQVALTLFNILEYPYLEPEETWRTQLGEIRATLPQFTRDQVKIWWRAAQAVLLHLYGKHFEEHPMFAKYQDVDRTPGQVRDKIRKEIKQSFERLAPK